MKPRTAIGMVLTVVLLSAAMLTAGHFSTPDFDRQVHAITVDFRFDFVEWEINTLGGELGKVFGGGPEIPENGAATVMEYYNNADEIRWLEALIVATRSGTYNGDLPTLESELEGLRRTNKEMVEVVERIIESQIREALTEEGIVNPLERYAGSRIKFPPVNIVIERPPHLLVISPRDRIESVREVALLQEMTEDEMERIETEVDALGMSSLVVRLGGIATYPNFVSDRSSLRYVLNTASEEWLHQYLTFTPLGIRYVLDLAGIRRNYDIATMNETVAGMVSKEIGAKVYERYYTVADGGDTQAAPETGFDFNKEMRETRKAVDEYLAAGEVERAEEYMEERRQYLADNGYIIRKLNQAYFAFHGTYADAPTSISPIGEEFRELRDRSVSLKDFLDTAVAMTSRRDLAESVE